jgi:hypothetical protein
MARYSPIALRIFHPSGTISLVNSLRIKGKRASREVWKALMTENNTNDAGQPSAPEEGTTSSDTRSKGTTGSARKSKKPQKVKTRKSVQASKGSAGKETTKNKPKNLNRRNFIIGFIALIVVFDIVILSVVFFSGIGPKVAPNSDPKELIRGQLPIENAIPEVGYDPALSFANHTDLTIANTSSMKPIENNLFKKGGAPDGSDLLYDAMIVNRVLRLNTDWIDYLNQGNQKVFESLSSDPKDPAKQKLIELGGNSQIAYHRIALGEIRHIGSKYYIITQASYILVHDGQQEIFDDLFVYELIKQGNTLVVANFERIPQYQTQSVQEPTGPEGAVDGAVENPDEAATDEASEGTEEGAAEGAGEGEAEEQPEGTTEEEPEQ